MSEIKSRILEITKSREYISYNKYHEGNIFSITRTSRLEHMHSNFIAWLLDSQSHHGLGDYPIKQFLAALSIVKDRPNNVSAIWITELDSVVPAIQMDSQFVITCCAEREVTFEVSKKRSIDILLKIALADKTLPIIIENKVDSSEHDNQTEDYFNWAEEKFKDRIKYLQPIYVYLIPEYNSSRPKNTNFIEMKYQDLLDYVLEPSQFMSTDMKTKERISEYIRCLSYQTDNIKGENTMAISSEEREILENFYDKNKKLMNAVFEMMAADDDVDPKIKAAMSTLITTRDYSKYEFDGSVYKKNQLVLAVIKKYVADNNPADYSALEAEFPKSLQGSLGVIKRKADLTKNEIDQKRFYIDDVIKTADGTEIVVCTQWRADTVEEFIKKAQEEFNYAITKKI